MTLLTPIRLYFQHKLSPYCVASLRSSVYYHHAKQYGKQTIITPPAAIDVAVNTDSEIVNRIQFLFLYSLFFPDHSFFQLLLFLPLKSLPIREQ